MEGCWKRSIKSLEIELERRAISYQRKAELKDFYKDRVLKKTYIPDLLVCDSLVVELKSASALAPENEAQLLNYMRITRYPVGYLINFGPVGKLQWRRFLLSEYLDTPSQSGSNPQPNLILQYARILRKNLKLRL